jgi:hypothetical protein
LNAVYGGNGSAEQLAGLDLKGKLVVLELSTQDDENALTDRIAAIAHAGAAMVALASTAGQYGYSLDSNALPLPVLDLAWRAELVPQVVKLFEAARTGTAKVDVTGRANSRTTHDLYTVTQGSLPANLARTVHTKELAAVVQRYHGNGRYLLENRNVMSVTEPPDAPWMLVGGSLEMMQGPLERTEYFTPGSWQLGLYGRQSDYLTADAVTLKAGQTYRMDWLAPVFGPTLSGSPPVLFYGQRPWVWQQGTTLDVLVPLNGDGAGHAHLYIPGTGYTELFRDGASVGRSESAGTGRFDLPAAQGTYRLVTEDNRGDVELSTKVVCDWTVKLGNGEAPPLLTVGFQPQLDLTDTVKAGHDITVPATVTHQGGATSSAIASLTVGVSYDDGTTWTDTQVKRDGDKWTVILDRTTAGYASLRAHAADQAGNTVTQTIIRALRIG